jgi:WhiB family redox-sensing transcriptional regulator
VEPCLTWALETGQDAGVWGGTSEDERRALKRRSTRAGVRTA